MSLMPSVSSSSHGSARRACAAVFIAALALGALLSVAPAAAVEIRVTGTARLAAQARAAGTTAQISGTLRDELGRGLPGRAVRVVVYREEEPVYDEEITTGSRGEFAVEAELPPGDYTAEVRFDRTEHLEADVFVDRLRLEPKPVEVRLHQPDYVLGRDGPVIIYARARAGVIGLQGEAEVEVGGEAVGVLRFGPAGRGTFDVGPHLVSGENRVRVIVPGSPYRQPSSAEAHIRFAESARVEARLEERLERLSRGLAIRGTVVDDQGPVPGLRVIAHFTPTSSNSGQADGDLQQPRAVEPVRISVETDEAGAFSAFVAASDLEEGSWRGRARVVPPVGDPIEVDAGTVVIDHSASRLAFNLLGLLALLLGLGAFAHRGLESLHAWWKARREAQARARRHREALAEQEAIVPVYLDEGDDPEAPAAARDDLGGLVWDLWRERALPAAELTLTRDGEVVIQVHADTRGRFRLTDLPAGDYRLEARAHGYMPGALALRLPHDGRLSNFRLDLIAVPLKIRRLYSTVVEGAAGEDCWGRITPREIEATLEELVEASEFDDGSPAEPSRERADLHRAVLEALRASGRGDGEEGGGDDEGFGGDELLAALTEIVEESYYSGRSYGESAFRLARAIALRFQDRARGDGEGDREEGRR